MREFLYVDDLADACVFLMKQYSGDETVIYRYREGNLNSEFGCYGENDCRLPWGDRI